MPLFEHVPHPRTKNHGRCRPAKVADQLPVDTAFARFNARLALRVTAVVGTMWCAYAFTLLALFSLPSTLSAGNVVLIVAWIAQTFLQLVLLSVIMVSQNIQGAAADKRAEDTYKDAEAVLHEALQIQEHLAVQDDVLLQMTERAVAKSAPAKKKAPAKRSR